MKWICRVDSACQSVVPKSDSVSERRVTNAAIITFLIHFFSASNCDCRFAIEFFDSAKNIQVDCANFPPDSKQKKKMPATRLIVRVRYFCYLLFLWKKKKCNLYIPMRTKIVKIVGHGSVEEVIVGRCARGTKLYKWPYASKKKH